MRAAVEERLVSGDRAPRGYYPAHPLDREIEDAAPGWGGETLLASDNLDEVVAAVLHDFNLDAGAGAAAPEAIEVEIDGATYRIDLAAAQDPAPPAEREARVPKLRNQLKGLNGDLQEQAQRIRTMRERIMARREADTGFAEDEEKEDASGSKLANDGNAQEGRARAGEYRVQSEGAEAIHGTNVDELLCFCRRKRRPDRIVGRTIHSREFSLPLPACLVAAVRYRSQRTIR